MSIRAHHEEFPLARVFTIARGSRSAASVVRAEIEIDGVTGQGECVPYARYGETVKGVMAQIEGCTARDRMALQQALPPGAARNALDCAFWDWEAKRAGKRVWDLASLAAPEPLITAFTLSLAAPDEMQQAAQEAAATGMPLLKTKLGGDAETDIARIQAVRAGAPDARIIVDANEGWDLAGYQRLAPIFVDLGVEMVEQPLPAGQDDGLRDIARPLPVCADESCHDRASLPALVGKYDMINLKLDKTGGLTEALALREAALAQGFALMTGCMVGTSLAMAPAVLLAQGSVITDLDGPLWMAQDRAHGLKYADGQVFAPVAELWG